MTPTEFNVKMVSDIFFERFKELSVQSLKQLKDGRRPELRLVRSLDDWESRFSFAPYGSTSLLLRTY